MEKEKEILQIITNETIDASEKLNIVTPSIYASLFAKFAQQHNQPIENEHNLSYELLKDECATLTELQNQTSKSTNILSKNTNRAIDAIKEKNETLLQEVLKETESLRREINKLKESVYHDELTHTYNRKWLHDNYVKNSTYLNQNGILVLLDLNYFKIINDTYGHIIGDKVLIFIANRLKNIEHNIVRYGGDEFIILFPETITIENARKFLEKLRDDILSKKLKAHKEMFTLSFSFGITYFQENDNLSQVIDNADKNMYEDKIHIKKKITGI
jgi:diguanylate cyclase (GGDEF)-like protein